MTRLQTSEATRGISTRGGQKYSSVLRSVYTGSGSYSTNTTGDVDVQPSTHFNLVPKSSGVELLVESKACLNDVLRTCLPLSGGRQYSDLFKVLPTPIECFENRKPCNITKTRARLVPFFLPCTSCLLKATSPTACSRRYNNRFGRWFTVKALLITIAFSDKHILCLFKYFQGGFVNTFTR